MDKKYIQSRLQALGQQGTPRSEWLTQTHEELAVYAQMYPRRGSVAEHADRRTHVLFRLAPVSLVIVVLVATGVAHTTLRVQHDPSRLAPHSLEHTAEDAAPGILETQRMMPYIPNDESAYGVIAPAGGVEDAHVAPATEGNTGEVEEDVATHVQLSERGTTSISTATTTIESDVSD